MKKSGKYSVKPGVAVIGGGYWGKNLIRNFHNLKSLKIICDSDSRRLKEFKTLYPAVKTTNSYSSVLDDLSINAVVIATPAEKHGSMVRDAIAAGKHVFVEKPLCLSESEGEELKKIAEGKGLTLMVGHLLQYHPAFIKLKQLVHSGKLGRIQYIYSNRLNLGKIRREENILWSFAPHDVSVIVALLDEMPESVSAQGGNYLDHRISDVTVSLLSFPSGVKAHIFVSWLHPYKDQRLVVVGDRKMAVFNDMAENDEKLLLYSHKIEWKKQVPIANKAKAAKVKIKDAEPLREECAHFINCIRKGSRPRTDADEALRVLKIIQACESSVESGGKPVAIDNPNRKYFIHPTSIVDKPAKIGEGTKIWHFSHILKDSSLGRNCRIGQNVVIGPNVKVGNSVKIQNNVSLFEGITLEDYVFCGPSAVFTNVFNPRSEIPRMNELRKTLVRRSATIGANATIVCGNNIGKYAFVGAGSVVTKDVPDYALVIGNPAVLSSWMCECGEKISFAKGRSVCHSCGRRYIKKSNTVKREK